MVWKSVHKYCTMQGFCKAEIVAADEWYNQLQHIKNCMANLGITNVTAHTIIYNYNQATVNWAMSVNNKVTKHINLKETTFVKSTSIVKSKSFDYLT